MNDIKNIAQNKFQRFKNNIHNKYDNTKSKMATRLKQVPMFSKGIDIYTKSKNIKDSIKQDNLEDPNIKEQINKESLEVISDALDLGQSFSDTCFILNPLAKIARNIYNNKDELKEHVDIIKNSSKEKNYDNVLTHLTNICEIAVKDAFKNNEDEINDNSNYENIYYKDENQSIEIYNQAMELIKQEEKV